IRPGHWPRACNERPWTMGSDTSRRCALWVSPSIFAAAQELAELIGVDVDTFIAVVVSELRDEESVQGLLRARGDAKSSSHGHLIPISGGRSRRVRRSRARLG